MHTVLLSRGDTGDSKEGLERGAMRKDRLWPSVDSLGTSGLI